MEIKISYVGTLNGVSGIWCGFCPEGVEVTEERQVLYPAEGCTLRRISTQEVFPVVWLKDGDTAENYEEIVEEIIEEENEEQIPPEN